MLLLHRPSSRSLSRSSLASMFAVRNELHAKRGRMATMATATDTIVIVYVTISGVSKDG